MQSSKYCFHEIRHKHVTRGRISTLQSYLVLFEKDCNHIWSLLELRLQSYQVPFVTNIAIMFGPHSNFVCNHIWSHT